MYAIIVLSSALLVAAIDQLAKNFVVLRLSNGAVVSVGLIQLRSVINRTTGERRTAYWAALLAVETAWLAGAVQMMQLFHNPIAPLALGAALGGAASNAWDGRGRGGVVDYMVVGFWRVFNLADVAIVLGVALTVLFLWAAPFCVKRRPP